MKYKLLVLGIIFALAFGIVTPLLLSSNVRNYLASLFFTYDLTSADVQNRYQQGDVSVLIVPGHDGENPGTVYRDIKEADQVAVIGEHLYKYLKNDGRFNVTLARNQNGYTKEFADYFSSQKDRIGFFIQSVWQRFHQLIRSNQVEALPPPVLHNRANKKSRRVLYGINKWANENAIDIVLHLHLNDYPRSRWQRKYSGFSIYIPASNLPNYEVSRTIAESLRNVFSTYWAVSNLPVEKDTIIEDTQLIAIGSAGSLWSGSVYMEYGYIYESRFHTDLMLKEVAFRTYQGLLTFFGDEEKIGDEFSWVFPYEWNTNIPYDTKRNEDVAAAQAALFKLGFYPPLEKTLRECPINGNLKTCTRQALANFQKNVGIQGNGEFGPKTRAVLNNLF